MDFCVCLSLNYRSELLDIMLEQIVHKKYGAMDFHHRHDFTFFHFTVFVCVVQVVVLAPLITRCMYQSVTATFNHH